MKSNEKSLNRITVASLVVALGIIYGDIGTSPLYVLRAIVGERIIDEVLVYGGVSCIFWTLMLQTSIKYIWLTLKADNEGEGGIFSLYALIRKYGRKLVIPTILGATALLADGIITPPITVSSAIEGLQTIVPNLPVITIVILILSLLFFFQRFGTQKVGGFFGPIMVIWFTMLFVLGFKEIVQFPEVLKAFSPYYAYQLLANYPHGFWLLGAVFLATTGAEALYSDLGHCGRKNIRITWFFVKVSLITNYLGQAAWVMSQGRGVLNGRNPFFEMMPPWFLLTGIIIATMASIIASQALISGSYTLISEAMYLNFWPRVKVRQPTELKGQIYIPSVNIILWIGCIMMILYFQTSANMEAAYGFSITIAMMMTTIMLSYFMIYILKWNKYLVISILLVFSIVELSFFVANAAKIRERWMFLFFELFIFLTMYSWYYARIILNRFLKFEQIGKYSQQFIALSNDFSVPLFATHLVYLTKANDPFEIEEKIIHSVFSKKPKRAQVYWLVHLNRTEHPYTLDYNIKELVESKIFKININVGFRIPPRTELFFKKIIRELIDNKELTIKSQTDCPHQYSPEFDFKFVVIEKYLSVENELSIMEGLHLNAYFILKRLGQNDRKAFGLDRSDVIMEYVPLIYHPVENIELIRKHLAWK